MESEIIAVITGRTRISVVAFLWTECTITVRYSSVYRQFKLNMVNADV